jgi:hypothetical protein
MCETGGKIGAVYSVGLFRVILGSAVFDTCRKVRGHVIQSFMNSL